MDHEHLQRPDTHVHPLESPREYVKFALVIAAITTVSLWLTMRGSGDFRQFLNDFMAVFFLVFGLFKLMNLEMFAVTYRSYDIIAQRSMAWAYLFPFVEIGLGLAYLFSGGPALLHLVTMSVTGTAAIGVFRELTRKSKIMCACLGTVIRLPLSKVSLVEDVLMFAMAAAMLFITM